MICLFAKNTAAWAMNVVHKVVHAIIYGVKFAAYTIGGILLTILTIAALRYCLKSYLESRRKRLQQIAATEQRQRDAEYNQRMAQQRQEDAKRQQDREEEQRRFRVFQEQAQRVKIQREAETLRQKQAQESRRAAALIKFQYDDWRARCDNFFANRETARTFPHPPNLGSCTQGCKENFILIACRHSMRKLYSHAASGQEPGVLLKEERIVWHPDRLSRCLPKRKDEFQAKASELFKIIGMMLDEA
jgi:hypothetical protein